MVSSCAISLHIEGRPAKQKLHEEGHHGTHRCDRARRRHRRHLDRAPARQAGSRRGARRPAGARRGDLLRQRRHHRGQHALSARVSGQRRAPPAHCAQARSGGKLPFAPFAAGGAVAAGLLRRLASPSAGRDRADHPSAVCPRAGGARGPPRRCRRHGLPAPGGLAQALSHRRGVRRDRARTRPRPGIRHCASPARSGRSARARAASRSGLSSCRPLAGRRQREQSAGGHQGLCGALGKTRRRGPDRQCPLAPPRRRALADRDRGRSARCLRGRAGARAIRAR